MVRFYITFKLEAPIYPEGYGRNNTITLTSIMEEFNEMVEKYGLECREPHIQNPNIAKDSNGNYKVVLGKFEASCRCSMEDFIEFYKKENGHTYPDGQIAPFMVNLAAKKLF